MNLPPPLPAGVTFYTKNTAVSSVNKIRPLPQHVIDSIAAGEVLTRPSALIKELIENSLDASSSRIDVSFSAPVILDKIVVTDDGFGISRQDLALAATRFCTSKISSASDLSGPDADGSSALDTFGFRGEALASASSVGRLRITSRPPGAGCAFVQCYSAGMASGKPRPSAGNMGTTVMVEDLFLNVPARKRAYGSVAGGREEYSRAAEVVRRYSIHCVCPWPQVARGTRGRRKKVVAFTMRKSGKGGGGGGGGADVNTAGIPSVKKALGEGESEEGESIKEEDVERAREAVANAYGTDLGAKGSLVPLSLHHWPEKKEEETKNNNDIPPTSIPSLDDEMGSAISDSLSGPKDSSSSYALSVWGLISSPTYITSHIRSRSSSSSSNSGPAFILFINHRLVSHPSLRRAVESTYADVLRGAQGDTSLHNATMRLRPPFIYLHLMMPGRHVDVNCHPSKETVALLHEDEIVRRVCVAVRETLVGAAGTSRVFKVQSLVPVGMMGMAGIKREKKSVQHVDNENEQDEEETDSKRRKMSVRTRATNKADDDKKKFAKAISEIKKENSGRIILGDITSSSSSSSDEAEEPKMKGRVKKSNSQKNNTPTKTPPRKNPYSKPSTYSDPKRLVRTNLAAKSGAIEPFLVGTPQRSSSGGTAGKGKPFIKSPWNRPWDRVGTTPASEKRAQNQTELFERDVVTASDVEDTPTQQKDKLASSSDCDGPAESTPLLSSLTSIEADRTNAASMIATPPQSHMQGCPGAPMDIDFSQPGAFALALCRCHELGGELLPRPPPPPPPKVKLRRRHPTPFKYTSIQEMRAEVGSRASCRELTNRIRSGCFVGAVGRSRSLVQSGTELLLMDHYALGRELFYQLALMQFGGHEMASIGFGEEGGVDVLRCLVHALELRDAEEEHEEDREKMHEIAGRMAVQATMCLRAHRVMLSEYFSIHMEVDVKDNLVLLGLPILIDGHQPSPHGLPTFLLRLATEVKYGNERSCFEGICTELGSFYACLPLGASEDGGEDEGIGEKDRMTSSLETLREKKSTTPLIDPAAETFLKHKLFPSICHLLVPPHDFSEDGSVVAIAELPNLYKVFERC